MGKSRTVMCRISENKAQKFYSSTKKIKKKVFKKLRVKICSKELSRGALGDHKFES